MGWQLHQLDHMQIICTLLQTDNHASTSPLRLLQAGCPFCPPPPPNQQHQSTEGMCQGQGQVFYYVIKDKNIVIQ